MTFSNADELMTKFRDAQMEGDREKANAILRDVQKIGQEYITDEDFMMYFDQGREMARSEAGDDLQMSFLVVGRKVRDDQKGDDVETSLVVFAGWNGDHKEEILKAFGAEYYRQNPGRMITCIVHVAEAWKVSRDKDSPQEDIDLPPSESPDRIEVVIVHAMTMDFRQAYWTATIDRDADGDFIGLKDEEEIIHDPKNPVNPRDMQANLSKHILVSNAMARMKDKDK